MVESIENKGLERIKPFLLERKNRNDELRKNPQNLPLEPLKPRKIKPRLNAFKFCLNDIMPRLNYPKPAAPLLFSLAGSPWIPPY